MRSGKKWIKRGGGEVIKKRGGESLTVTPGKCTSCMGVVYRTYGKFIEIIF